MLNKNEKQELINAAELINESINGLNEFKRNLWNEPVKSALIKSLAGDLEGLSGAENIIKNLINNENEK